VTFKTISVIGLGYIGLPTAAMFASRNINVIGVDTNDEIVNIINQGKIHIVEPDLDKLVCDAVKNKKLSAINKPVPADAFIIAVPTPLTNSNKPDLSYLMAAAKSLIEVLKKGDLIIIESTVPVGTTQIISEYLSELCPELSFPHQSEKADIFITHSPERVLPGRILTELIKNDRVIGGISKRCGEKAANLYGLLDLKGEYLLTKAATAELVKLSENAYRDVNIAFANELSIICERLNINPWEVIQLANHHPRVDILQPGPGVGGHCIAIDPWFIINSAPNNAELIRTARNVNDSKPGYFAKKVISAVNSLSAPIVACLGLTYKADVDDLRQSPAVKVVSELASSQNKLDKILVVEPNISSLPIELQNTSKVALTNLENAIDAADIIVILVDHKSFKEFPYDRIGEKIIFDTKGIWQS